MNTCRNHFRTLAALVLVAWMFSAGAAFAQACVSTIHLACEECCTEAKPAATVADQRLDALAPAGSHPGPPPAPVDVAADAAAHLPAARWSATGPGRPPRIPIVFLRLAL
jgi:hypothetical protein